MQFWVLHHANILVNVLLRNAQWKDLEIRATFQKEKYYSQWEKNITMNAGFKHTYQLYSWKTGNHYRKQSYTFALLTRKQEGHLATQLH